MIHAMTNTSMTQAPAAAAADRAARRQAVIEAMRAAGGGVAILPTAPERMRNRDSDYPYRWDSYFHYLAGFPEPEAVLVIVADADRAESILFCREKNEERETWDGFRYGPQAAAEQFGFDRALPIGSLDEEVPRLLANRGALFHALGADETLDARVRLWLGEVRAQARAGVCSPTRAIDLLAMLDEMRLRKDEAELDTMRRAARISAAAHRRAMIASAPGRFEYEIEAELLHEFRRQGSQAPAYGSIVAGGRNGCVLHYRGNDAVLRDGDLLLIDAGCELDSYASDITRTFPVSGRFSAAQRDVYAVVLAAQAAARDATRPGAHWNQPHEAAVKVLAQGMLDLGLLKGSLDAVLENGDYRRFYMHRTGHWLGMDVHDAGEYKLGGDWRPLVEGMVLTIEPGCYIRPAEDIPEAFWNIGIRIEDDAVVTADGCELITEGVPKAIDDIEALMREARHD